MTKIDFLKEKLEQERKQLAKEIEEENEEIESSNPLRLKPRDKAADEIAKKAEAAAIEKRLAAEAERKAAQEKEKADQKTAEAQQQTAQDFSGLVRPGKDLINQYLNEQKRTAQAEQQAAERIAQAEIEAANQRMLSEREYNEQRERTAKQEEKAARQQEEANRKAEEVEKEKERYARMSGEERYEEWKRRKAEEISNNKIIKGMQEAGKGISIAKSVGKDISDAAKSGGKKVVNVGFATIQILIWMTLIFAGFSALTFWAYTAQVENCSEFRSPDTQGWASMRADLSSPGFRGCMISNIFSGIGIRATQIITGEDMLVKNFKDFLDREVYRATGDYYYSNVDENREPIGVFIEGLRLNDRYFVEEPIAISANINVKTIGDKLQGSFSCLLDEQPQNRRTPATGEFSADMSTSVMIQCGFDRNRFTDTGRKKLEIITIFDFGTFGYMTPSLIKQSIWDGMTDSQKQAFNREASDSLLKTTNAPVQIGGELGARGSSIVVINDYDEADRIKEIPFGMTLHADRQRTTWDLGRVQRIKKLVISIPNSFNLREEMVLADNLIESCIGYAFKKSDDCSDLNEYLGEEKDYRHLCTENDRIYMLDQSGNNPKLEDIRTFKTLQCTLEGDIEDIFKTEESEQLGFNQIGIKIYTEYTYSVSRVSYVNLVRRAAPIASEIRKYTCTSMILDQAKKGREHGNETKDNYKQFQGRIRNQISASLAENERAKREAMMAAIIYKYSGFSANEETDSEGRGVIDYLSGCLGRDPVFKGDHDRDLRCLANDLNTKLRTNLQDVEKTLEHYYNDKNDTYAKDQRAEIQDYYNWLATLCTIPKTEQDETEDEEEKEDDSEEKDDNDETEEKANDAETHQEEETNNADNEQESSTENNNDAESNENQPEPQEIDDDENLNN
ncbi:MAG: hypothetical protein ACMXX5_00960 [Candidatus Woesearchaeota archaeon]